MRYRQTSASERRSGSENKCGISTTVAWGAGSVAELSKEIETIVKKYDKKMKVKTALADGNEVTFAAALKMPTRAEAIGRVVMLAMAVSTWFIGGPTAISAGSIRRRWAARTKP